jgi:large subunit ribosomal protein L7/L12
MPTTEELVELISNMKVGELNELVKALQEQFGVEAAAPVFQGAPTAVPAGVAPGEPAAAEAAAEEEAPAEEEQTEFDVVLESFGDQKIKVIKEVRAVTDLGLKEAKDVVESAPVTIKEAVPKEEADKVKEALEAVGATVQIK